VRYSVVEFVHKNKEFGVAYRKHWGEMCTGFGGQTWSKETTWKT